VAHGQVADSTERVMVNLPRELVKDLRKIADSRGIGLSTLIRMLLYASLERRPAA